MATPSFAIPVLEALIAAGHQIEGVYCQTDKPSGRGRRLESSPVKEFALARGLPLFQPPTLRRPESQGELAALKPDVIVVAAYGKILPPPVLQIPPLGCLNLHPSLLPKYRGPSPVVSAVLEGERVTGMTIILLDEGMDTGPILAQGTMEIVQTDNAETLTQRLFKKGAEMLIEILPIWAQRKTQPQVQDESQATLSRKISKEDGQIDWQLPAEVIARRVRAFYPWPGTHTFWRGKLLKILEATPLQAQIEGEIGTVVREPEGEVGIITGQGLLAIKRLQLEGHRAVSIRDFLQGYRDFMGSRLT
ncbi:MAG: methionyl-tRNA formyltransferase [Chloroflexi bacterium]|nr:methionyl-tRNA formyltransferase [Chloroflexota bacterium]